MDMPDSYGALEVYEKDDCDLLTGTPPSEPQRSRVDVGVFSL